MAKKIYYNWEYKELLEDGDAGDAEFYNTLEQLLEDHPEALMDDRICLVRWPEDGFDECTEYAAVENGMMDLMFANGKTVPPYKISELQHQLKKHYYEN